MVKMDYSYEQNYRRAAYGMAEATRTSPRMWRLVETSLYKGSKTLEQIHQDTKRSRSAILKCLKRMVTYGHAGEKDGVYTFFHPITSHTPRKRLPIELKVSV